MSDEEFTKKLDEIMLDLARDVKSGKLDEKPTERVGAVKTLMAYEAFKTRKNRGKKPGSALDAYRSQIDGTKEKESTDGDALN